VSFPDFPLDPQWADYVMGVVEAEERIKPLDGIGCQPVAGSQRQPRKMLEWIGDGLRSKELAFPEKNGPITWPKMLLTASLNHFQCSWPSESWVHVTSKWPIT